MTLGVFGGIIALSTRERPIEKIDELAGLSKTHPWSAAALSVCLFSLAGVPPMAGFFGKYLLFASTVSYVDGGFKRTYQILALIGALNAAVGASYYLRIIVAMYLRPSKEAIVTKPTRIGFSALATCAVLSIVVGVLSPPFVKAARDSAIGAVKLPEVETPAIASVPEKAAEPSINSAKNAELSLAGPQN